MREQPRCRASGGRARFHEPSTRCEHGTLTFKIVPFANHPSFLHEHAFPVFTDCPSCDQTTVTIAYL